MSDVLVSAYLSQGQVYPAGTLLLAYSDNGKKWGTCPIGQASAAPVSTTAFNGFLWAVFRGQTTSDLLVSSSKNWHNTKTGPQTNLAPSVTVFKSHLWIAYIGEASGHVEVISSSDGKSWSSSTPTGQSSKVAPSITVFNDQLWIAYVGEDTGHVEVISSTDGKIWLGSNSSGQSSKVTPSLTVFKNALWIAYIGEDTSHVEAVSSSDGKTWGGSVDTGQSSKLPAAIVSFKDHLWITYVGEATGQVELISSADGSMWGDKVNTGETGQGAPTLASVPAVPPASNFGGASQYLFTNPQSDSVPVNTSGTLSAIRNLLVTITIKEELKFDQSIPPSFQLNCMSPPSSTSSPWKIGFQQYCLTMQPNSTQLILHIQNFAQPGTTLEKLSPGAVYAGDSSNQINFPNLGSIPAGWVFQLALQYSGDLVSGARCLVIEPGGSTAGTLSLGSVGLALAANVIKATGEQTVDQSWLAPIVAFQLNLVAYAEGAHTTFSSGSGTVIYQTQATETVAAGPLVAATGWGATCCNGEGTAESSNSVYSVVPQVANIGVIQIFGAPPGV